MTVPAQRLKTRAQFQAVMAGRTVARTTHFVLHRLPLEASQASPSDPRPGLFPVHAPWLGAVIPKRWARRAVTRNTIKRQIFAMAQDSFGLPVAAHVVRLRSAFDRTAFPSATSDALRKAVRAELQQLFREA